MTKEALLYSTGWRILLCLKPGTRVLEVSADSGERAAALEKAGAKVVCLRRSRAELTALRSRGFETFLSTSGSVSPSEAGRFDAVVVSAALGSTQGSEWMTTELGVLLRHMRASLRPGAPLVLSLPNPLFRLPGLSYLLAWLRDGEGRPRGRGWDVGFHRSIDIGALRELFIEAGFTSVRMFAPLPEAHQPKFLVPLGDPNVMDYFFRFLVPRTRSAPRRATVHLARLAAKYGLLERLLPSYEVAAARATAP